MARLGSFARETRGAAAAEMVLWVALMLAPIAGVVEVGAYLYQKMQVTLAAQAGVQAARKTCSPFVTPITGTGNCTGLGAAVTSAVQATTLGSAVTVASGTPIEGYYCASASGQLTLVGTAGTPPTKPSPFTCASVVAGATAAPGSYLRVTASADFAPIFPAFPIASLLPNPIASTAWTRLD